MSQPPVNRPRGGLALLCLGLFLVLAALSVKKPGLPMQIAGDEPTWILMAGSLAEDGDLHFEDRDLTRLFREFPFVFEPQVALRGDASWNHAEYDRPRLYAFLGAPFFKLFGTDGLIALNLLCLLLAIVLAGRFRREDPQLVTDGLGELFAGGFMLLSAAWLYAFRTGPEALTLAATTAILALGLGAVNAREKTRRIDVRVLLAGLALLPLLDYDPVLAWIALPVPILAAVNQRWRVLATFVAGAAIAILLAWILTPSDGPDGLRTVITVENPLEWPLPPAENSDPTTLWQEPSTVQRGFLFLVGRHGGLLPYFPLTLVALLLFAWPGHPRRRDAGAVLMALLAAMLALPALDGTRFPDQAAGHPWLVALYPAFFFIVGRLRPTLVVASFALGTWAMGAILWTPFGSVTPNLTSQAHVRGAPFRWMPTEAALINALPDYTGHEFPAATVWTRNDQAQRFGEELWLLGGEPVDLWLASDHPIHSAVFDLRVYADPQRLDVTLGASEKRLDFTDVPDRGASQRLELTTGDPDRVFQTSDSTTYLYRVQVASERGESPSWRIPGRRHFYAGAVLAYLGPAETLQRDLYTTEWQGCGAPEEVTAGEAFQALVRIQNNSEHPWPSRGPARVRLSYHWLAPDGTERVRDGLRTELPSDLEPGAPVTLWQKVEAPELPGEYVLEFEPLYERVSWFAERRDGTTCRAPVRVR